MVLTTATAPQALPYAAAYLVEPDALESVQLLLQASGLRITPRAGSETQVPHYNISVAGKIPRRYQSLKDLLTERELQVLNGMSRGKSNGDIARETYLSEDTIKAHSRSLFKKLGARDRAHAVAIGFWRGILGGDA